MSQSAVPATRPALAAFGFGTEDERAADPRDNEDATFTLDERGRISRWNAAAEALYGFSAAEVVGRHPTMLVPPELDLERDEHVREVLTGRGVQRYETERMRKDGSRLDVAITLSPLRDRVGRIVGASADVRENAATRHGERPDLGATTGTISHIHRGRSQRRLAEAQERFRIAFLHAPNGIALLSTAPGSEGSFLDAIPRWAISSATTAST